jgi:hypothetical protein
VEISKGSKVKYELDKKTGLIKVSHLTSVTINKHTHGFMHTAAQLVISELLSGGSRAVLVGGVPAQLRLHPANALRGQRPHGCTGPHAGVCPLHCSFFIGVVVTASTVCDRRSLEAGTCSSWLFPPSQSDRAHAYDGSGMHMA